MGVRERAPDLVQDCLERALSRRHLWKGPGNFRAWLMTIMHNLYANEMLRLSTRPWMVSLDLIEAASVKPAD
jgi:RNA polymerase sigma-70 factor (ECF subfamily)